MSLNRLRAACLAAALLALGVTHAPAQYLPVNVQMTATHQGDITLKGTTYTLNTTQVRVTSKDLLHLLAQAYNTSFPAGARLVLVDFEFFQVQNAFGDVILSDVSPVLAYGATMADGDFVMKGKFDGLTHAENTTASYTSTLLFDDYETRGNWFLFTGLMQERFVQSARNSAGLRSFQNSYTLNGAGDGYMNDNYFVVSGKVNGSTRGVYVDASGTAPPRSAPAKAKASPTP